MLTLIETKIEVTPVTPVTKSEENNPEIQDSAIKNALESESNNINQNIWNLISQVNGFIAMIDFDYKDKNKDDLKDILESVINDLTIDIGMIYKVISMINSDTENLINAGKEKAEEIIDNESDQSNQPDIENIDTEETEDAQ